MEIRQISEITSAQAQQLAKILLDAVNDGASVGFLEPFSLSDAASYWLKVNLALNDKHRLWIVLENDLIIATVQLILSSSINAWHRAEVVKLLVASDCRGRQISSTLMAELEKVACELGVSLLLLDTQSGSTAEHIYIHLGWQKVGEIPNYAKLPNGVLAATSYFYKLI